MKWNEKKLNLFSCLFFLNLNQQNRRKSKSYRQQASLTLFFLSFHINIINAITSSLSLCVYQCILFPMMILCFVNQLNMVCLLRFFLLFYNPEWFGISFDDFYIKCQSKNRKFSNRISRSLIDWLPCFFFHSFIWPIL